MSLTLSLVSPDLKQVLSEQYCSGRYVRGKLKVMQEFLAELLTIRGSVRFAPDYGCPLMESIGRYNSVTEFKGFAGRCVYDVAEQMQNRLTGNEPPDEVLEYAELEDAEQKIDSVVIKINLATAAGDTVSFQLPFSLIQ